MSHTHKPIDHMEAVYGGVYKRARAELGVTAFGMQVLDLPPGFDAHPEHDHAEDGQEEVYMALSGSAEVEIEGERLRLDPGTMVRVGPGTRRKLWPCEDGARLLTIGGMPGRAYQPPAVSELGAPDPSSSS